MRLQCRVRFIVIQEGKGGRGFTMPWGASSRASGRSSAKTIHTMHPAANPSASGSSTWEVRKSPLTRSHLKPHSDALFSVVSAWQLPRRVWGGVGGGGGSQPWHLLLQLHCGQSQGGMRNERLS